MRLRMLVLGVVVALTALASPLAAAPATSSFSVRAAEVAFTQTKGTFVGTISGGGTVGSWRAVVQHLPLGSRPAAITGGSLRMATLSSDFSPDLVRGSFAGGSVSVLNPGRNCTNQTFAVHGSLAGISTRTSQGGSGTLDATLTHYRQRVLGRCLIYAASVSGSASFSY
jgi:hypothetical protein